MIIAGIDYSMSCPAMTIFDTEKEFKFENFEIFFGVKTKKYAIDVKNIHGSLIDNPKGIHPMDRYERICKIFAPVLKKYNVEKVCLEGYALSAKGLIFNISENTTLLKHFMWKNNIDYITPSPTQVKKFYTGKGNAKKDLIVQTFIDKTGIDLQKIFGCSKFYSPPINDIVDSIAMLKFLLEELKKD